VALVDGISYKGLLLLFLASETYLVKLNWFVAEITGCLALIVRYLMDLFWKIQQYN